MGCPHGKGHRKAITRPHWDCKVSRDSVFWVHGWDTAPPNVHRPTLHTNPEHPERAGVPLPPEMFL